MSKQDQPQDLKQKRSGASNTSDNYQKAREAKRARFDAAGGKSQKPSNGSSMLIRIAAVAVVLMIAAGGFFVFGQNNSSSQAATIPVTSANKAPAAGQPASNAANSASSAPAQTNSQAQAATQNANGDVVIPVSSFADGKAKFYSAQIGGKTVKHFALKSSDGVIRAAFDACDVCFQAKKGYHQEGDEMVCNNCGQRFKSVRINEVKNGCNPSPLERTVEGDNVVIKSSDLAQGVQFF